MTFSPSAKPLLTSTLIPSEIPSFTSRFTSASFPLLGNKTYVFSPSNCTSRRGTMGTLCAFCFHKYRAFYHRRVFCPFSCLSGAYQIFHLYGQFRHSSDAEYPERNTIFFSACKLVISTAKPTLNGVVS